MHVLTIRCGIPVIIMGETGCGKTRLIKFMCDLWKPPGAEVTNMILIKVSDVAEGSILVVIVSSIRSMQVHDVAETFIVCLGKVRYNTPYTAL